jgi:C-terminal processing protease CtpA/Prc
MSHWAMERKLRGAAGSELTLTKMASNSTEQMRVVVKREKLQHTAIECRADSKSVMITLPDLGEGRADELNGILRRVDSALPLVVDLRKCFGGNYEEAAKVASLLGYNGTFATLQEVGQPDRPLDVTSANTKTFPKIAVLIGLGTIGPAETLAVALKHLGSPTTENLKAAKIVIFLGERTMGQAVERGRFYLKQGGAVELVVRRWLGAGGEKLDMGSGGGRLSRTGLAPDYSLQGIADTDELLPRILEALAKGQTPSRTEPSRVASLVLSPSLHSISS